MLKRRAFWITLVLLVLAAVGGRAALHARQAQNAAAASRAAQAAATPAVLEFLPSDLVEVRPRELRQTLSATGSLRAVNQAAVKARVAGEVKEVLVREGETVTAGQVVVRMDDSEYRARLVQAEGVLAAGRGQLDIAGKARENNRVLVEKGFISRNAFDTAASQYDIARANLDSARGALDVAKKALSDTVIRAPIAGVVAVRSVHPGEKVSADNRLLDVVDLRRMEMEIAVPTSDILGVSVGQEVSVRVEGMAAPLSAKVVRINPATQSGSRSIMVYLQLDNPGMLLRIGMFGEARLTLAKRDGVLAVPQSALQTGAGQAAVYAIENGRLQRKPVRTGAVGSDDEAVIVEITEGLAPGARIVRSNLGNLRDGAPVRIAGGGGDAAGFGNQAGASPAADPASR